LLRWISEISRRNGASVILADVDPRNASYSLYSKQVARVLNTKSLGARPSIQHSTTCDTVRAWQGVPSGSSPQRL